MTLGTDLSIHTPDTHVRFLYSTITEEIGDIDVTMNIIPTATNSTCAIDNPKYVEDQQQDTSIQSLSEESSDEEVEEFTQGPLGNKFMDTKQFLVLMKVPRLPK